ncbi:MAG: methyltransferase domain-containing protein [Beijerinckiaceae bacterium]
MSSSPVLLFDRALQRRRLARALAAAPVAFLLDHAGEELSQRLTAVNRTFSTIADIGTPGPQLTDRLRKTAADAIIFRLSPLPALVGAAPILGFVGDEETLAFRDKTFDLAVSALALHNVNDLPGCLVQVRRILKPDGLFMACLLGGRTLTELRMSLAAAEAEIDGGASPRVAPFADLRDIGGLMQRAGFALPVVDLEPLTVRYGSMFALLADLRAMGAGNALMERRRAPLKRGLLLRAAEVYAERFADPDGKVRATFELVFLSGWAPHESQQQPLKPGAAQMRLADALRKKK